jgi:pSer/pThr/pTyr-binding forkhead associated (FHA) protein
MPKLTLKFKNNVIKIYNFSRDKSISIGRRENNDIVIANLTVSGNHAKIDFIGDGYLLTDLKSKNRTFVNDEEVTSIQLNDNDVIGIGKHTIIFNLEGEIFPDINESGMDQTMAMNTDAHKDLIKNAENAFITEKRVALLGFIEGGEGNIELSRKRIKIGKDPSSDIIIHGFMVGKTVAIVNQTPHGYSISHSGSLTKIKVNNKIVKGSVFLEEFDLIRIGSTELQFFYK